MKKNWIGFDQNGKEKTYTNSPDVSHILIQNCSLDEFRAAVTFEPVKFRVVEENELANIKRMFDSSITLKFYIQNVLAKDTFELQATKKIESSLTF